MRLKHRALTLIFVLLLSVIHSKPACAADHPNLASINGSIADVDAEGRKVTVHWMYDTENAKYQDLTLAVPQNAVVLKGTDTITLDDLEQGDTVIVRYDPQAQPLPKAASITVSE